jgi:CheY-like chemotaxis protein
MIAEDENPLRMLAVDFLTDAGFKIVEAPHAEAALTILQERSQVIHLLFTDINMPGSLDGLELAHHVRRTWPKIALLIVSGDARHQTRAMPEGGRFLLKPYQHHHVVRHIRELVAA